MATRNPNTKIQGIPRRRRTDELFINPNPGVQGIPTGVGGGITQNPNPMLTGAPVGAGGVPTQNPNPMLTGAPAGAGGGITQNPNQNIYGSTEGGALDIPTDIGPYSGLPPEYLQQLMEFVMPQLFGQVGGWQDYVNQFQQQAGGAFTPVGARGRSGQRNVDTRGVYSPIDLQGSLANIDESTQNALGIYQQQLNDYLGEAIPGEINQLANRGVLDSSVAGDTLAQTAALGAQQASTKGYETLMNAAQQKAGLQQQEEFYRSGRQTDINQQAAMANATSYNDMMRQASQFDQQRAMWEADVQTQINYNTALQAAGMQGQITNTLAGLLQYGQSQSDPSVMWRAMLNLLGNL